MKKLSLALVIATLSMSLTVFGEDSDLLSRIEALEKRVAQLESMFSGQENVDIENNIPTEEKILDIGTWIVGEDIPAGKYDLTCSSMTSWVKLYDSYETRKEKDYDYFEDYMLMSSDFLETQANMGEDYIKALSMMYITVAHNVRIEEGNCIYIEGTGSIAFTPVQ